MFIRIEYVRFVRYVLVFKLTWKPLAVALLFLEHTQNGRVGKVGRLVCTGVVEVNTATKYINNASILFFFFSFRFFFLL